jgi:hypothetical protein
MASELQPWALDSGRSGGQLPQPWLQQSIGGCVALASAFQGEHCSLASPSSQSAANSTRFHSCATPVRCPLLANHLRSWIRGSNTRPATM